jgi:hypothetical protein
MESSETLRAELAATRERAEKAELERDNAEASATEREFQLREEREALAATLVIAEKVIAEAMAAASVMNLNKAGCLLSAYQLMGRDYAAILSSRDAAQRKAGAVWALRELESVGEVSDVVTLIQERLESGEVKP